MCSSLREPRSASETIRIVVRATNARQNRRLRQQRCQHQSCRDTGLRGFVGAVRKAIPLRCGSGTGRLRGRNSRLAALPATLERNSRPESQVSMLLHRACNTEILCQPAQRNYWNPRPGVGRGCHLLQGSRCVRTSVGPGTLPCRCSGVGHWTFTRGHDWICHQSCSRLRAPPRPRRAAYRRERSLGLALCWGTGSRTAHRGQSGWSAATDHWSLGIKDRR